MRRRKISILLEARSDLLDMYLQIAEVAGDRVALNYTETLKRFCESLDLASERGHRRDDIMPGIRVIGFRGRVTIIFSVEDAFVLIQRIFYGGRDWEAELSDESPADPDQT